MGKKDLILAKKNKNDEFYTQYDDIEKEVNHYRKQLEGKVIYSNCDNPKSSHFYRFFIRKYKDFKLKGLITTYYPKEVGEKGYMLEISEDVINGLMNKHNLTEEELFIKFKDEKDPSFPPKIPLEGDEKYPSGDFRSKECVAVLKKYKKDLVVITNPPFSLFREYVSQLMEYKVKFLIIGSINAISYKEIFPFIKENKIWLGHSISSGDREFEVPNHCKLRSNNFRIDEKGKKFVRVVGVRWFTNLNHKKRNEEIYLIEKYKGNESKFPKYDNYDAINVDKVKDIPKDYKGIIGVPISFLDKFNPEQFEITTIGSCGNFEPNKIYDLNKIKSYSSKGELYHKSRISWNRNLTLKVNWKPKKGSYGVLENNEGFIYCPYARVLIKNKKVVK